MSSSKVSRCNTGSNTYNIEDNQWVPEQSGGSKGQGGRLLAHDSRSQRGVGRCTWYISSQLHTCLSIIRFRASHSFVSLKFSKSLNNSIGYLEYPLRVEITDDQTIKVSKVQCNHTLRINDSSFSINLIYISM